MLRPYTRKEIEELKKEFINNNSVTERVIPKRRNGIMTNFKNFKTFSSGLLCDALLKASEWLREKELKKWKPGDKTFYCSHIITEEDAEWGEWYVEVYYHEK